MIIIYKGNVANNMESVLLFDNHSFIEKILKAVTLDLSAFIDLSSHKNSFFELSKKIGYLISD